MNYTNTIKKISIAMVLFLTFAACSDDDNNEIIPTQQNIVELAIATPELSSLVAALTAADLVDALNADGPFTVFAPTNEAFATFLSDYDFATLDDVPVEVLQQVLLYHVVASEIASSDLTNPGNTTAMTLQGADLTVTMPEATITDATGITDIRITAVDIEASNGVVHLIDKVMLPFLITEQNIVDLAIATPELSSLVAALTAADLVGALNGDGPFTVLAPTNDAFANFLSDNGFATLDDVPVDVLTQVLLNHVISADLTSTDLVTAGSGYTNTLASGADNNSMSIYFNTSNGVTFNGTSSVSQADITASNGVIHIVDAVIGLPTVVTFAAADPTFSTLVTALTELTPATNFVEILQGEGPFTVFAPTDEAFSALPSIPDEEPLTQILLYHVVAGNIASADLTNPGNTTAMTLQGEDIIVTMPEATITDASGNTDIGIIAVDVQAVNGIIHVINKVMLPLEF
ncbi:MAG: fasciclin domain-containing protein [Flavobacteriaceae bacterium]|nr:fasciclin domain-containing protein [Flavobacteriaceae bacterium]